MKKETKHSVINDLGIALLLVIPLLIITAAVGSWLYTRGENSHFQQLDYTFEANDCDLSDDFCELGVTVENPTSEAIKPQYIDTGGGPLAEIKYNLRVYDTDGKSCAAYVFNGEPFGVDNVDSKQIINGEVRCQGTESDRLARADRVVIYGKEYLLR